MWRQSARKVVSSLRRTYCDASYGNRVEMSVNQVNLVGRVGQNVELRGSDPANPKIATFSVVTNQSWTDKNGEWKTKADWHNILIGKPNLRDYVAQNLRKGDRVMIQGRISYDSYTNQEDRRITTTQIVAENLINFSKKHLQEEREQTDFSDQY
ncbi:unnamed protein product [Owenia fusiformis]|uniref:Uncharacterized protein n=1 Tax=Owenia fusiformis TaxID=6347 RepID=A0A8J1U0F9_OWEFU|nr:unnamed protein product [Owenia fusiformis]